MLKALRAEHTEYEMLAGGAIAVAGRDAAEVGGIASRAGVTVLELFRLSAGATLESLFLAVTQDGGGPR